jgi:type II secretory pathway pseudopilin PulG
MLALLGTFSIAYSIEAFTGDPPDCACFGLLLRRLDFQNKAAWVLGRNAALAVPPVLVVWSRRRRTSSVPALRGSTSGAGGFTLVEALVVIAIVATIVAILLPALGHARRSGRVAVTLNNLGQHASIFLLYSNDFGEQFPYFTRPEPGPSTKLVDPSGQVRYTNYFGARYAWKIALSASYYNSADTRVGFASPFQAEAPRPTWDYLYPCVFLTDPAYWRAETRMYPPAQFRSTRQSDVLYPSAKVLVSDESYWETTLYLKSPFAAGGCVDGNAQRVAAHRIPRPYVLGEGTDSPETSPYGYHAGSNDVFMHTIGGASARDFAP